LEDAVGDGLGERVLVDDAGGKIDVDSTPGEGTTFEIYLPAACPEDLEVSDEEPEAPRRTQKQGGPGRILLVEDERDLREPYELYLEREGHEVFSAGSYEEARARFDEQQGAVDLVVADVVLPDGSGVDLVRELRELMPDIGVVYVSGYAPDLVAERETVRDDGWRYLRKPVAGDELVATVGEVLGGR
ncbi:MAG: response regulator, partial [Bradymonadaceae bacterium]